MKRTKSLPCGRLNNLPQNTLPSIHRLWSKLSRAFGKHTRNQAPAIQPLLDLRFTNEREK